MNILCIGQVEDREYIDEQILKQTIQPTRTILYVDKNPAQGIEARRIRIAENHERLRNIVKAYSPDLVWQVEGDAELPENTLERLLGHYIRLQDKDFGYVSGIQVGRHGLYCLGAWEFYGRSRFDSIDHNKTGIQDIDATGFYCLLAPAKVWLSGVCSWDGQRYGPDVVWGLSISKNKYVDMDLHIGHKTSSGIIRPSDASTCNVKFYMENGQWIYKQLD